MTPDRLSKRVVSDRLAWVGQMVQEIRALPLEDQETFLADRRNVWAAESCLRRGLEALFDLGRHIFTTRWGRTSCTRSVPAVWQTWNASQTPTGAG